MGYCAFEEIKIHSGSELTTVKMCLVKWYLVKNLNIVFNLSQNKITSGHQKEVLKS